MPPTSPIEDYFRAADVFVHPSAREGLPLVLLEAMASGTPVVASRTASIPEICGPAVEYFDPYSITDIAATIERALGDRVLRERLVAEGRERVTRYKWEEAAGRVADVFRRVV